jgi:hypothetical protein
MADKARPKDKSKKEPEKKQAETVHLTPEELRAISGGTQIQYNKTIGTNSVARPTKP